MRLFYTGAFVLPLPPGHRFPMAKYSLLRERLLAGGEFPESAFHTPDAASDEELCRAHDAGYVRRVAAGELTPAEQKRIGFPWSPEMVERSRRSAGATLAACRAALAEGCAANLAGGTHHAQADRGEGFCVFNDAAVAARAMLAERRVGRVAVIDCDVHQGNGTATILAGDKRVFTFSIHGARNFPFEKAQSDLDIELADDTGDADYLAALDAGLAETFARCRPELVIYLAGADPYAGDRLGRLSLSFAGLAERDARVLGSCRERGIPAALAMAGGYAEPIADTVTIHATTIRTAKRIFG
ncbi:MAG: histone deacetylase [Rhodocyclales bacterium]|nr:histone deacetylase [Rhodocyclales bacterium]